MNVVSIPSCLPEWYDPSQPGFEPPESWKDARIRITVPIKSNAAQELEIARVKLSKMYPGARLHLVPDYKILDTAPTMAFDPKGGDPAALASYLATVALPKGITAEQIMGYLKGFLPSAGAFGVQGLQFGQTVAVETLCFEQVTFDWERKGLTLLTGKNLDWDKEISNGAGKSSFVTLPFLALFGRTFKDQTHDGWARQGARQSAVVSQALTLADDRRVVVVRGRKPNSFQVILDGKDVTMGDGNRTQDFLERLTNLSWSVLTNAVYIGQQEIGSVFGTEKERKELFSRLLGLERYLDATEKLRKTLRKIENEEAECASSIAAAANALAEAQFAVENLDAALTAAPEVDKKDLIKKQRRLSEIESLIRLNDKTKEDLQPELDKNQRLFEKALFKATDLEVRIQHLREHIEASGKVEGQCPTCGTKVGVEKLEAYQNTLYRQIETLEEELTVYEETQRKNRNLRKVLHDRFGECNIDNDKLRREQGTLLKEAAGMEARAGARAELLKLQADAARRQKKLTRNHCISQRAYDDVLDEKRFIQTCMAVTSRDGLPAYLMAEAAPRLNQAAAHYSEVFTAGEIGVHFGLDNGDIDIDVVNPHGGANVKDQSRGEMRMAAIVAALSFRDVLVKHNVLILDEPTDGLDPVNAAAFARGLNQVVDRFHHIVVISHNAALLAGIEPTLHLEIEKTGGVSRLNTV